MAKKKKVLTAKLSVSARMKPDEKKSFEASIKELNKERVKAGVKPIKRTVLFRKMAVFISGEVEDTKKAIKTIKYDEID